MIHHATRAALRRTRWTESVLRTMLFLLLLWAAGPMSEARAEAPAGPPAPEAPQDAPADRVDVGPARRPRRRATAREVGEVLERTLAFYGFVKPTVAVASGAVESFGRPNASAITAAGNPVLATDPDATAFTFQLAQSRVGVRIREGRALRGQIELDFVDVEKSSPTVASLPRLRVASIEWDPAPGHTLLLGQTWDMLAPLMPPSFNLVGAHFQAGNLGFMRPQLAWRYHPGAFEVGGALGLPAPNVGPNLGTIELGHLPTFAATIGWRPSPAFHVSASAVLTELRPAPDDPHLAWAAALSLEAKGPAGTEVKAEGYIGQDTASLGMLTLAQARPGVDVRDAGGWLSVQQPIGQHAAPYLVVGGAAVLNPDDVAPAYVPGADGAPATRSTTLGPGMRWNAAARLGLLVPVVGGLAFQAEAFAHVTEHALAPQDQAVGALRQAYGFEGGAIYRF